MAKDKKVKVEETPIIYNAVIYTDGGCKGTFMGWGAHGYLYDSTKVGEKDGNKPNGIIVTTEGYQDGANSKEYVDRLVKPILYLDWAGSSEAPGTNNRGELLGFIRSVETILETQDINVDKITILTDSKYVLGSIESSSNRTGTEMKNPDLRNRITKLVQILKDLDIELVTKKVLGHSGDVGNDASDSLATIGRLISERHQITDEKFKILSAQGYWKKTTEIHPFLNYPQLFFIPKDDEVNNSYIIIHQDLKEPVGKKLKKSSYGFVILGSENESIRPVEAVKEFYRNSLNRHYTISSIDLQALYKPRLMNLMEQYKSSSFEFVKYGGRNVVKSVEGANVVVEVYPPGLAYGAYELADDLSGILASYKNGVTNDMFNVRDITDMFYDDKGLKKSYTTQVKSVDYDFNGFKINLQLGTDIITRNQLKKVEKLEPRVTLIVIDNGMALEFCTIIELQKTGDIGIWANPVGNKVYKLRPNKNKKKK